MSGFDKFIQHIVEFTEEEVEVFIKEHENEVFYSFAYDCNAETSGIYLSFNTLNSFEETLEKYREGEYASFYNDEESVLRLKYNPGDWKYQNFVYIEFIYEDKIKELFDVSIDKNSNDLLNIAERALLDFRKTKVYQTIPKTDDFLAFCIDHDEDELDAIERSIKIN